MTEETDPLSFNEAALDKILVPPPRDRNTRVWAKLSPAIHEYFFRRVLAGEHKAKQEITSQFYEALYAECIRRKIPPSWNLDNTKLIHEIMSNLNFNERPPAPPAKPTPQSPRRRHDK